MKITISKLKQLIKEEVTKILSENQSALEIIDELTTNKPYPGLDAAASRNAFLTVWKEAMEKAFGRAFSLAKEAAGRAPTEEQLAEIRNTILKIYYDKAHEFHARYMDPDDQSHLDPSYNSEADARAEVEKALGPLLAQLRSADAHMRTQRAGSAETEDWEEDLRVDVIDAWDDALYGGADYVVLRQLIWELSADGGDARGAVKKEEAPQEMKEIYNVFLDMVVSALHIAAEVAPDWAAIWDELEDVVDDL
jgi:hypothetical protein